MQGGDEAVKNWLWFRFGLRQPHSVSHHEDTDCLQVSMQRRWAPPPRVGFFDLSPIIACQNNNWMFVQLIAIAAWFEQLYSAAMSIWWVWGNWGLTCGAKCSDLFFARFCAWLFFRSSQHPVQKTWRLIDSQNAANILLLLATLRDNIPLQTSCSSECNVSQCCVRFSFLSEPSERHWMVVR